MTSLRYNGVNQPVVVLNTREELVDTRAPLAILRLHALENLTF